MRIIGPKSWARKVKRVTTPKLPPPPRSAQKSSGCSSALTSITSPLASTSSRETKLSQVRPCLRENQPIPPPSERPATPVSDMIPAGTISRCGAVAASTSPSRQPPPACTSLRSGSTVTSRSPDRSMVRPPSDMALPATLWPPQRTEGGRPCSRAWLTAATTSSVLVQRRIRPGRRSTMAFHSRRACSYSAWSGPMISPLNEPASSSAIRSRSCSSIVDELEMDTGGNEADDMGDPFLRGDRAGAFGDAAHGVQRGGHGLEVIAGHRVGVFLLPGRAPLDPLDDQGEAEAEPQVVPVALELVGDRAEHRPGDAGERDPVRLFQRDPLGEALAAEVYVPVEDGVAVPLGDLAVGHAGHERQRVVGLEHQPVPDGGPVQLRLAGHVDRQRVRNEDHQSSFTVFSRVPSPSMVTRTTSPPRRYSPRAAPPPAGVPVAITSPGSSVTTSLAAAISSATGQTMSAVDSSCCNSPFTHSRSRRSCGSGTRKAGVRPGPSGSEPSADLAANQS